VVFAPDTELGLAAAAALVNTGSGDAEELPDLPALEAFLAPWGWTGSRTHDDAELEAVRALRPRLRALWQGDVDEVVASVNAMLRAAGALPQLVAHGAEGYHLHATGPEAPLADRMAVEAAMAVVDVVRSGELGRLRSCSAHDCEDVFVDLTRNRARRYCSASCGNRVDAAASRARRPVSGRSLRSGPRSG
jgi:predicted RNA-binding Zn ribbon-like protein